MDKLLKGAVEFRKGDYEEHKVLFQQLSRTQKPHTLFIGCSDSRIVPQMITQTLPGELFIVRNMANIVPPYRVSQEYLSTTSAIEYALQQLKVDNIIICGHSNCGGCEALHKSENELKLLPHTRNWLDLGAAVVEKVNQQLPNGEHAAREWLTEQTNVVEQIKHLLSYPYIKERYKEGTLKIHGWYYIIETGEVFSYNKEKSYFERLN